MSIWKERGKLSPEDIQNIIAEVRGGARRIDVARKYGIDHSTIFIIAEAEKRNQEIIPLT